MSDVTMLAVPLVCGHATELHEASSAWDDVTEPIWCDPCQKTAHLLLMTAPAVEVWAGWCGARVHARSLTDGQPLLLWNVAKAGKQLVAWMDAARGGWTA